MQTAGPTVTLNTENMSQAIAQLTQSDTTTGRVLRRTAAKRARIELQNKVYAFKKKTAHRKANKVARASRRKNRA
jgi:hypothetical protein